jgi:hypothetical protein
MAADDMAHAADDMTHYVGDDCPGGHHDEPPAICPLCDGTGLENVEAVNPGPNGTYGGFRPCTGKAHA